MITYKCGDVTCPTEAGPLLLPHLCNNLGVFGSGVALGIARRWPHVERAHSALVSQRPLVLGEVQFVKATKDITVANIIGQEGIGPGVGGKPPIRYEALREGLEAIAERIPETTAIVMPKLGSLRAGGNWDVIEAMIKEVLSGYAITVYEWIG